MEFDKQLEGFPNSVCSEAEIKVLVHKLNTGLTVDLKFISDALKAEVKRVTEFMNKHYEVVLKAEFKRIGGFIGKHYNKVIVTEDLVLAILDAAADMLLEKSTKEGAGARLFCCKGVYHDYLLSDDEFIQLFSRDEVKNLITKTQAEQEASREKAKAEQEAKLKAAADELTTALIKALIVYTRSVNIEMTNKELALMKEFKSQYKSYVFDGLSWCCMTPYIEAGHYIIGSLKHAYKNQYEVPDISCCPPEYNRMIKLELPKIKKEGFEAMLDKF